MNPAHLFLGTNLDNIADRHAKGRDARGIAHGSRTRPARLARGERSGRAKLTAEAVREIRHRFAAGEAKRALARLFGVRHAAIQRVVARRTWAHVALLLLLLLAAPASAQMDRNSSPLIVREGGTSPGACTVADFTAAQFDISASGGVCTVSTSADIMTTSTSVAVSQLPAPVWMTADGTAPTITGSQSGTWSGTTYTDSTTGATTKRGLRVVSSGSSTTNRALSISATGGTTNVAILAEDAPIQQAPAAVAGVANYFKTNAANAADTTNLNPGLLVFDASGLAYGVDLGHNGTHFRTRLFAANSGVKHVCLSHSGGSAPSGQSSFTDILCAQASSSRVGIGTAAGNGIQPSARLHVGEATLDAEVFRFDTTATNDDPNLYGRQQRAATTDATVTTLQTITLTSAKVYLIEARVVAHCTGGASCTAENGAVYVLRAGVKNNGGTATLIGAAEQSLVREDVGGWDATIDVTGATARVRVTGAASTNITWHVTTTLQDVGT